MDSDCFMWVKVLKEKYGLIGGDVVERGRYHSSWWKDLHRLELEGMGLNINGFPM